MSRIPTSATRIPNILTSRIVRDQITSTGIQMARLQEQISSGLRVNRASDDPVASSIISVLDARIGRADQRLRNYDHAQAALSTLDQSLGESESLLLQATELASSQVGVGSDTSTRLATVDVVESMIRELVNLSNARFTDLNLLGGSRTGATPINGFFEGYRYSGSGDGLRTDIGAGLDIPITIGAERALGALSARVEGDADLDPAMTRTTSLNALDGAVGAGVRLGQVAITIAPGSSTTIDLSGAHTVGDVADLLESAIRAQTPGALAGAYPGGVDVNAAGTGFAFNVNAGFTIDIAEVGGGAVAGDLGLTGTTYDIATPTNAAVDLNPSIDKFTTFGDLGLGPGTVPGDIVFRNGGRAGTVTVTAAMTISGFQSAVDQLNLGIRVQINDAGDGINVLNEVSGFDFSVEESGGGTLTATALGIRTFQGTTPTSVFNDGRGVEIADGAVDPITGLPDPARDLDFRITLTDGTQFDVDLTPTDIVDVAGILAKINADAALAGVAVPADFEAVLADGSNGIVLSDNTGGAGNLTVTAIYGRAAEDLGLLDGVFTPGAPASFAGEDRAKVRVDSAITALMDLREALERDDSVGITLAGGRLETAYERLSSARAVVGGRTTRLSAIRLREEDSRLLDQGIRSGLRDLDYIEASSRFGLLQVVQQAGLQTAAATQSLSLLDFLG
jgi:flagellin-like hook-associated protein FlgL